ncbi:3-deoxy-manno-octulosonate cytidylyltransferase (CMP-KDO synthetase) [Catalinimonas alkaloidigena]|uniref:3-deoxy-manno-octulosonate cytidylyltransferase n=1 Tax=Catalinimonas alkaloidigena TaxID=1075417 RepID=UPI0024064307|nr:3-deoxy-manno-octulosonate cytidylyltransferase [Catalinimonas alkaloidigena]MDF9799449.1 3-deoxy-manno-octulosonate cytidylyltransferase (CMP-KDO synthetase) [Catalinimonas alkaloidigena]
MKILGIIPARLASTRFPTKALVDIKGKSMVQRTFEQASAAKKLEKVIVATDHEDIYQHVKEFGGEAVMTSEEHPSGTDRCREALDKQASEFDYVINIQGDEPFIHPDTIDELASLLDGETQLATLVNEVKEAPLLFNPSIMKVIFNKNNDAIYFSRECIPYLRGFDKSEWLKHHTYYKHVCIYAYRADILREVTQLPLSSLEKAESLEQLRWLENGYPIKIGITEHESISIDTPQDLERALDVMGLT